MQAIQLTILWLSYHHNNASMELQHRWNNVYGNDFFVWNSCMVPYKEWGHSQKKNKLDIPNRLYLKIRRKYNKFRSFDNHTMLFLKFFLSVLDANGVVHRSHSPLLFIKNIYVIFYQCRGHYSGSIVLCCMQSICLHHWSAVSFSLIHDGVGPTNAAVCG